MIEAWLSNMYKNDVVLIPDPPANYPASLNGFGKQTTIRHATKRECYFKAL